MENLKVKITFKSGNTKVIESTSFYKGQFGQWVDKNLIKNEYQKYSFVVWNNILINLDQVEFMDEL